MKKRAWTLGFGPCRGRAGQTMTVVARPECFFKGRVLIVHPDDKAKEQPRLVSLTVGARLVLGMDRKPTFASEGDNLRMDVDCNVCWPGQTVAATVEFPVDGVFAASLIGDGITESDLFPAVEEAFR